MSDQFSRTRRHVDPQVLMRALVGGSRRALARAITFAESTRADHRVMVDELLLRLRDGDGGGGSTWLGQITRKQTLRVGVSGAPGVGKSTFIEAFGL
ncbi:MAG: LAO/AO transport system kinase, partial [Gammaproteobacteria bacterium]